MKHLLVILILLICFGFTNNLFHQKNDSNKIIGEFYRNDGGTAGDEFNFSNDFKFRFYHWCDICSDTEIYGVWEMDDSLLILTDTLAIKYKLYFKDIKDTIVTPTYRKDTLIIKEFDNDIFLCKKVEWDKSLLEDLEKKGYNSEVFACFKKKE